MIREICPAAIELIESFETLRLTGYLPTPNDRLTGGWGHTGPDVQLGVTYPLSQATTWLHGDLAWAAATVEAHATVSLTDNQFGALASIAFNIGANAFDHSTLLRDLDSGDYTGASGQFLVWDKQRGVTLPGLARRRIAEHVLFMTPDAP